MECINCGTETEEMPVKILCRNCVKHMGLTKRDVFCGNINVTKLKERVESIERQLDNIRKCIPHLGNR